MTKKLGSAILLLSVLWAVTSLAIRGGLGLAPAYAGPIKVCVFNTTLGFSATDDVFSLGYYNLATVSGISDNTLRIVNPGTDSAGGECANIYVFDSNQHMLDCCGLPRERQWFADLIGKKRSAPWLNRGQIGSD